MKTLPGLKIIAFFGLVSVVAFAVYASEEKGTPPAKHPKVIIKLGWEGATPDESEPVNYSPDGLKKLLHRFLKDPKYYHIRHYKTDGTTEDEGDLKTCREPDIPMASPTPSPTASATPAGPSRPVVSASPGSSKTQLTAEVALANPKDAQAFLEALTAEKKK
ncbi:MAG: hypothetical protein ACJ8M1_06235 [Chthoniobacterales bacterium]